MKAIIVSATAGLALFGLSQQASATVLYDNGPINGTITGSTISGRYAVSDSFTLSQSSILTGVDFGVWSLPGNTMTSVDYAITSAAGTYPNMGAASVTTGVPLAPAGSYGAGGTFNVTPDSFSLPSIDLAAGTYYLVLQNAMGSNGNDFFWDENNGPSTATQSHVGSIESESFQIIGTVTATPLPSTWTMLIAGFVGLGFFAYRGTKKSSPALAAT
jgi:hypothetical protein